MGFIGTAQLRPTSGQVTWDNGKYQIKEIFRIITDNVQMEGDQVLSCPGMPRIYDPHPRLPLLRARRFQADRIMPASTIWEAEVTFETPERREGYGAGPRQNESTRGTGVETPGQNTNPLLELPSIKFDFTEREVPITQVTDAVTQIVKPPTSSQGEPYDPPPKMLKVTMTLDIARNEPLWANHPALGIAYANAQNADKFWGMAPGVWRIKKISPERQVKQQPDGGTAVFLRVVYQLEAADTWDLYVLDYGTWYLAVNASPGMGTAAAQIIKFQTSDGHPTAGALDGQGGPLVRNRQVTINTGTSTITIVSPAPGNTLNNGNIVTFNNVNGALPIGIAPGTAYFVRNVAGFPLGNSFQIADTIDGNVLTVGSFSRGAFLSSGKPEATNMIATGIAIGMNISGNGIPGGTTVTAVEPAAGLIVMSANATVDDFQILTFTAAATTTGVTFVSQPAVWNIIRPPPGRKPFAPLGLPQSWFEVQ
jgi:hypothetical protein